jgi:hypothetical protein
MPRISRGIVYLTSEIGSRSLNSRRLLQLAMRGSGASCRTYGTKATLRDE